MPEIDNPPTDQAPPPPNPRRYDKTTLAQLSEMLAVIGEINRLKILASLHPDRRLSIQGMARHAEGNPDVISRHVKKLREAGLLEWVAIQDEDLRICHHRLKPGSAETDAEGKRWIDFGKVKICID